jgi:hypothetical protein
VSIADDLVAQLRAIDAYDGSLAMQEDAERLIRAALEGVEAREWELAEAVRDYLEHPLEGVSRLREALAAYDKAKGEGK